MGYTHYWQAASFTDEQFHQLRVGVALMVSVEVSRGVNLDFSTYDEKIFFNGIEEEAHESFVLDKEASGASFCKTNAKPYDTIVVASLNLAKKINPNFEWSSDGEDDELLPGAELARCIISDEEASTNTIKPIG